MIPIPFLDELKQTPVPNTNGVVLTREQIVERIAKLEVYVKKLLPMSDERRDLKQEIEVLQMVIGERKCNPATGWGYRTCGESAYDWAYIRENAA